jgi:hypothetical protein
MPRRTLSGFTTASVKTLSTTQQDSMQVAISTLFLTGMIFLLSLVMLLHIVGAMNGKLLEKITKDLSCCHLYCHANHILTKCLHPTSLRCARRECYQDVSQISINGTNTDTNNASIVRHVYSKNFASGWELQTFDDASWLAPVLGSNADLWTNDAAQNSQPMKGNYYWRVTFL